MIFWATAPFLWAVTITRPAGRRFCLFRCTLAPKTLDRLCLAVRNRFGVEILKERGIANVQTRLPFCEPIAGFCCIHARTLAAFVRCRTDISKLVLHFSSDSPRCAVLRGNGGTPLLLARFARFRDRAKSCGLGNRSLSSCSTFLICLAQYFADLSRWFAPNLD
jgi:hypothetical protein